MGASTDEGRTDAAGGDERRRRIRELLRGYFDTKTHVMVQRVLSLASSEEIHDDDAMDALFDEFVDELQRRYDREDPGWTEAAESFLRSEFDRQVTEARRRDERLRRQLEG